MPRPVFNLVLGCDVPTAIRFAPATLKNLTNDRVIEECVLISDLRPFCWV